MSFKLSDLGYSYDALEPYVDAQTMEIHHDKHHRAYVEKLNTALENHTELQSKQIEEILHEINDVPDEIRTAVQNNGGGHHNHSLFWQTMMPGGSSEPTEKLGEAINATFGSFGDFKAKFTELATTRFGSGWAWLASHGNQLEVYSTPNQDSPLMEGKTVILGLDVWEHAYYLKYQNRRPEYIENWWHVVNWEVVGARLNT